MDRFGTARAAEVRSPKRSLFSLPFRPGSSKSSVRSSVQNSRPSSTRSRLRSATVPVETPRSQTPDSMVSRSSVSTYYVLPKRGQKVHVVVCQSNSLIDTHSRFYILRTLIHVQYMTAMVHILARVPPHLPLLPALLVQHTSITLSIHQLTLLCDLPDRLGSCAHFYSAFFLSPRSIRSKPVPSPTCRVTGLGMCILNRGTENVEMVEEIRRRTGWNI